MNIKMKSFNLDINSKFNSIRMVFILSIVSSLSGKGTSETHNWENPEFFRLNKMLPHAAVIPVSNGTQDKNPYCLSLNGKWKFKWSKTLKKQTNKLFLAKLLADKGIDCSIYE